MKAQETLSNSSGFAQMNYIAYGVSFEMWILCPVNDHFDLFRSLLGYALNCGPRKVYWIQGEAITERLCPNNLRYCILRPGLLSLGMGSLRVCPWTLVLQLDFLPLHCSRKFPLPLTRGHHHCFVLNPGVRRKPCSPHGARYPELRDCPRSLQ